MTNPSTVIVSACLLGVETRYDGAGSPSSKAHNALSGRRAVPVCPEQLGGLPTPRPCAAITGGTGVDVVAGQAAVVNETGRDVTANFVRGARMVLRIARITGAETAFLREKSPSCGIFEIYAEDGKIREGPGVTAALLTREGIECEGFGAD